VLSLIYALHKSLGHAIRFLATDLSQELSLQITMKSSCHFLFNHLALPTLQNSTKFSNSNSLIPLATNRLSLYRPGRTSRKTRVRLRVHWPVAEHWAWRGPHRIVRIVVTLQRVVARSTENTAPIVVERVY
jgi:hypothetical protein